MSATLQRTRGGLWVPGEENVPDALSRKPVGMYRWNNMTPEEKDECRRLGMAPMAGGAARTYVAYNGHSPTTAALAKVGTGTTIKTMQQVQTSSTSGLRVIEWGISFDGTAATPIECELIDTVAIAATVTAYTTTSPTDLIPMNGPNDAASTVVVGTAASGFTATAEGAITVTRLGDCQLVAQAYVKQFPLGREFEVPVSHNLRVRVTAPSALNAITYIIWEE